MEPKRVILQIVLAMIFISVIDFIWLGFVAKSFYLRHMEPLIIVKDGNLQINYVAGVIVYLLLAIGLAVFVLSHASESSPLMLFFCGALLGLVVYGIYDMTNMATLKTWPVPLALADMAWGSFVCGVSTILTHICSTWILGSAA